MPSPNADFVDMAAGWLHSLGLKSDGTIVAWGRNGGGQCTVPVPNADFVAIAAGFAHSLGLKSDGTIVAWGGNDHDQCTVPVPNTDFMAVAAGWEHSLGLKSDGTIVAWGRNGGGQCTVPLPNGDFVAVAAGLEHSLGLKLDGTIVAWGSNLHGQCTVPAPNVDFLAVTAGAYHSLGLKSDGTIVAWGSNSFGECTVPSPNAEFVAVAAGSLYSLGLKSDGTTLAWGDSDYGQCAVPTPNADFVAVTAGWYHSLGLKSDCTIVAWGRNPHGQCTVPAPNADFVDMAAGWLHSLGLKSDGTIVAWGHNDYGQCTVPAPNADFVAVSAGWEHSLGLKSDGTIVAWGSNDYGQCTVLEPNADFVAVAGAAAHSLGLKSDGTIVAWGNNDYDQCMVPSPDGEFVAVAGGWLHSLGLSPNGEIMTWGSNNHGQCTLPTPNADFVAVEAGGYHNMGLKSDGTIVAWGLSDWGQCAVPAPNADFVAMAAGGDFSLGIRGALATPPASPTNLSAATLSSLRIDLTWDAPLIADTIFWIQRSEGEAGPWSTAGLVFSGETHYCDHGLEPNRTYFYRVIARGRGGNSDPSPVAIGYANAPPEAALDPEPSSAGRAVRMEAVLHDANCGVDPGVVGARLYCRVGGATIGIAVDSLSLADPDTAFVWAATIPAACVGASGIQYCLTLWDRYESVRIPAGEEWLSLPVTAEAFPVLYLAGQAYQLTGLPLAAKDPWPSAVFQELGPYDARHWRYWTTWDASDSTYAEHPSAAPARAGQGFWIISQAAADVHVSGVSTQLDSVFALPLVPGWNMVANPFAFTVPAAWMEFPPAGEGVLRGYTLSSRRYEISTGMDPSRGYFLWLDGDEPDTLRIAVPGVPGAEKVLARIARRGGAPGLPSSLALSAATANGRAAAHPLAAVIDGTDTGWRVRAEAVCGDRADRENWFGQCEGATAEKDRGDLMETPPPPGESVGLSFRAESGAALMTDFRGLADRDAGGATWTLVLTSNLSDTEAQVRFTVERPLPADWALVAIDPATLAATDLQANPELRVRLGPGTRHRRSWQLAAGPAAYVAEVRQGVESAFDRSVTSLVVGEAWPNPSGRGSGVEIELASPRCEQGEVSVYDVRGRLVRRLHAGEIARGWQRLSWDGRDGRGQDVSAGVYLLRVTVGGVRQSRKVTVVR